MHICYPYQIGNFVDETIRYIRKYQPSLTVINSTVVPGTTRAIYERTNKAVTYSPTRGKHNNLKSAMLFYRKFIAGFNPEEVQKATSHFKSLGMSPQKISFPECLELAKLLETTYFAVLIAWAQDCARFGKKFKADYDEIVSFFEEIPFFPPVKYTPGFIGGHCIISNIHLLKKTFKADVLDWILKSNDRKARELNMTGKLRNRSRMER